MVRPRTAVFARPRHRRFAALAALAAVVGLGSWGAGAAPKKRYYIEIEVAKDKTAGGKPLAEQAIKKMKAALADNPMYTIAADGDGAPPITDEPARRAWLKSKGLVGLALQLTLSKLVEKKEKDKLTLTFEMSALLITRPGGWMIITTKGIGEADGFARAPVLDSCVEGAAAGAAENLTAHLTKKPVEDK